MMELLKDLLTLNLSENTAVETKYEKFKAAILERDEELIKVLDDMRDKISDGEYDEAVKLARDFVNLAQKASDLADKLPDLG